jgi:hypothetical protein
MQNNLEELFPPTTLGKELNIFEENLRCPCCGEFFNNPVSLNCGHVYCSECIRKHLDSVINNNTSNSCPSCKLPSQMSHIRPDRSMAILIEAYILLRPKLMVNVEQEFAPNNFSESIDKDIEILETGPRKTKNKNKEVLFIPQKHFHGISKDKIKASIELLCKASSIKLRLDGDKDALSRRYRDFVHLNNSQLNKENPLSIEEMVKEITKREALREKEAKKDSRFYKKIDELKNGKISEDANSSFLNLAKVL